MAATVRAVPCGLTDAKGHRLGRATSKDENQSDTKRRIARSVFGDQASFRKKEIGARRERPNWGLA
jgi:hypothetical protein